MKKVEVFQFKKYSALSGRTHLAPRLGTREAIATHEGVLIEGTGREADASLLDGNGTVPAEQVR